MRTRRGVTLLGAFIISSSAGATDVQKVARDLGFFPTAMSSSSFRPGQVLSASVNKKNVVSSNLVCDEASYAGSPPIVVGDVPNHELVSQLQAGVNVTSVVKKLLNGKIDVSHIRKINLVVSNVHSEAVPLAAITSGVMTSQTDGCSAAIDLMRKNGYANNLRTVETALRADISYVIIAQDNASLDLSTLSTAVSAALGGNYQALDTNTISGKGLVIGLMLSPPSFVLTKATKP